MKGNTNIFKSICKYYKNINTYVAKLSQGEIIK